MLQRIISCKHHNALDVEKDILKIEKYFVTLEEDDMKLNYSSERKRPYQAIHAAHDFHICLILPL